MYTSFKINNFRCFHSLSIGPLQKINLITGDNNVGKTALLEALWLHHGYHNPELGLRLRTFRGLDRIKRDEFLWDLFLEFDPENEIDLTSRTQDGQEHTLQIVVREHPISHMPLHKDRAIEENGQDALDADMLDQETTAPVESEVRLLYTGGIEAHAYVEPDGVRFERPPTTKRPSGIYLTTSQRSSPETLAERFGNLVVEREDKRIVEILRIIEPRLKTLIVRHMGGGPVLYGDIGLRRLIPLPLMGDGLGRWLNIALAIPQAQGGGILLIDEIENGLYYSVMRDVWIAIDDLAHEYDVQIFATTHSEECVFAAYQAFAASEQFHFVLHRLEKVEGRVQAVTYDQGMLEAAFEIDAEVR
jgi:hypothetical protein